jgi:hypothetical protein
MRCSGQVGLRMGFVYCSDALLIVRFFLLGTCVSYNECPACFMTTAFFLAYSSVGYMQFSDLLVSNCTPLVYYFIDTTVLTLLHKFLSQRCCPCTLKCTLTRV